MTYSVYQIACGEPGRDYREIFFDNDVMILGPSHKGDAKNNTYDSSKPNSQEYQVNSFCTSPKPGDFIILRFAHEIIGLGRIPEGENNQYTFQKIFGNVYGWDLNHCRRVMWYKDINLDSIRNVYADVKQKPSFSGDYNENIKSFLESLDHQIYNRELNPIKNIDSSIYTDEELGIELFKAGISNNNIILINQAIKQANRLLKWYWSGENSSGRYPTENEVISHIVLPFFLALGWSHQQIAIEWNKVDGAFFLKTPTNNENCIMIMEAKGLSKALNDVLSQPLSYIQNLNLVNVKKILVTNGHILLIYKKESDRPIGYIDFSSIQKEYILPKNTHLIDSLVMLLPTSF
jgi:hypothetical protein